MSQKHKHNKMIVHLRSTYFTPVLIKANNAQGGLGSLLLLSYRRN